LPSTIEISNACLVIDFYANYLANDHSNKTLSSQLFNRALPIRRLIKIKHFFSKNLFQNFRRYVFAPICRGFTSKRFETSNPYEIKNKEVNERLKNSFSVEQQIKLSDLR